MVAQVSCKPHVGSESKHLAILGAYQEHGRSRKSICAVPLEQSAKSELEVVHQDICVGEGISNSTGTVSQWFLSVYITDDLLVDLLKSVKCLLIGTEA